MKYKYFSIFTVSAALLITLTIATFNYCIDSLYIFTPIHKSPFMQYAQAINNKQTIIGGGNINDRLLKKYIIQTQTKTPHIIALGSSRIMQLNRNTLQANSFFNYGMSGAGIKDYLGIIGAYLSKNQLPDIMIFGLDPWIFNKDSDLRFLDLQEQINLFYKICQHQKLERKQNQKILELLSWDNTLYNIESLFSKYHITLSNNCSTDQSCIDIDGSMHYPSKILNIPQSKINLLANQYARPPLYQLERYQKLETQDFLLLMNFLIQRQVKIVFYLPPYHPIVFKYIENNLRYRKVFEADSFIRNFASQHNIPIIGNYDPSLIGLTEADFHDGMHTKPEAIHKIFKNLPQQLKHNPSNSLH